MSVSPTGLAGKKVVTIGAGTGQRRILTAVKGAPSSLTALVSVTDDGGHSGELRRTMNIPQVGDAKQCLLGLAADSELRDKFAERNADGVSIGNLLLAEYTQRKGIGYALTEWGQRLACAGSVLPVTEQNVHIAAELVDGTVVTGEWPIIQRTPRTPISRMMLTEKARAYPPAVEAIEQADVIVIAPGSFYTGLISGLLPLGIQEAIKATSAEIVMVSNMMTQPGLTDGWDAIRHVDELIPYTDRTPTALIVNNGEIPTWVRDSYAKLGSSPVTVVPERIDIVPYRVVTENLVPEDFPTSGERPGNFKKWPHLLTHCPERTKQAIERAVTRPLVTSS